MSSSSSGGGALSAETLRQRIDTFLASRGYRPDGVASPAAAASVAPAPAAAAPQPAASGPAPAPTPAPAPPAVAVVAAPPVPEPAAPPQTPAEFVCEEDVRQAVKANRKILLGERTIVTPSARELGEQHRIFV